MRRRHRRWDSLWLGWVLWWGSAASYTCSSAMGALGGTCISRPDHPLFPLLFVLHQALGTELTTRSFRRSISFWYCDERFSPFPHHISSRYLQSRLGMRVRGQPSTGTVPHLSQSVPGPSSKADLDPSTPADSWCRCTQRQTGYGMACPASAHRHISNAVKLTAYCRTVSRMAPGASEGSCFKPRIRVEAVQFNPRDLGFAELNLQAPAAGGSGGGAR